MQHLYDTKDSSAQRTLKLLAQQYKQDYCNEVDPYEWHLQQQLDIAVQQCQYAILHCGRGVNGWSLQTNYTQSRAHDENDSSWCE